MQHEYNPIENYPSLRWNMEITHAKPRVVTGLTLTCHSVLFIFESAQHKLNERRRHPWGHLDSFCISGLEC